MAHAYCQTPSGHTNTRATNPPTTSLQNVINTVVSTIADTLAKRAQRRALMRLSDAQLSDIGLSRSDAEAEYRKSYPL
jgi:uncharacterized protein YjiS (DUF1127 family)